MLYNVHLIFNENYSYNFQTYFIETTTFSENQQKIIINKHQTVRRDIIKDAKTTNAIIHPSGFILN